MISGHRIFSPILLSSSQTKVEDMSSESNVPASIHLVPSGKISTWRSPSWRYNLFRSVISSSPLADGVSLLAISLALPS